MSFKRVEDDVREILEKDTTARCDDMALYANYVFGKIKDLNCGKGWLQYIFSNRRYRIIHGIAPYETVSRIRRKLQEKNKDLRPSKAELEERNRLEKKYKEYARNGGGSK